MVTINSDRCKACGLCVSACPKNALEIDNSAPSRYGDGLAVLTGNCIECGSCYEICPDIAIEIRREENR